MTTNYKHYLIKAFAAYQKEIDDQPVIQDNSSIPKLLIMVNGQNKIDVVMQRLVESRLWLPMVEVQTSSVRVLQHRALNQLHIYAVTYADPDKNVKGLFVEWVDANERILLLHISVEHFGSTVEFEETINAINQIVREIRDTWN